MITAEEARKIVDIINPEIENNLKMIETAIIEAAYSGEYTAVITHYLTDCGAPGHEHDKKIMEEILKVLRNCGYETGATFAEYRHDTGDILFTCTEEGRIVVNFLKEG